MTSFFPVAAVFFILFMWLLLRKQDRSVSFVQKLVVRISILAIGLQILVFPASLKFSITGPMAPVVILLLINSFCSSVVIVELVRVALPSGNSWAMRKYRYLVLTSSVSLVVVSIVGVFLSRLWQVNV
jgi:uncharacterized membrane protein YozB (DUF420 family)